MNSDPKSSPVICEEIQKVLVEFLQSELEVAEEEAVRAHLLHCVDCCSDSNSLEQVLTSFGGLGNDWSEEVSQTTWSQIARELEEPFGETGNLPSFVPSTVKDEKGFAPVLLSLAASILVAALTLIFWSNEPTVHSLHEIQVERGSLYHIRDGNSRTQGTRSSRWSIREGDRIRADEKMGIVRWSGSTTVYLDSKSSIRVVNESQIDLLSGRVYLVIKPGSSSDPRIKQVGTPLGTVEVVGTRFCVDLKDGNSRITVIRGSVRWTHQNGQAAISAGEQLVASDRSEFRKVRFSDSNRFMSWINSPVLRASLEPMENESAVLPGSVRRFRLRIQNIGADALWIRSFHAVSPYYFVRLASEATNLIQTQVDFRSVRPNASNGWVSLKADDSYMFEFGVEVPQYPGQYHVSVVYQNGEKIEMPEGFPWRGFVESNRVPIDVEIPD
ncbi:MAG: FecR family protein [Planctomycetota bacterium]|jgi:hypothetical protein|nr:FecR family protein [Planctomycetota bacterium]